MTPRVWPLVVRLLTRSVPARHLPPVLGDLAEDFNRRVVSHGSLRAECWLLREGVSLAAAYRWQGRVTRPRSSTAVGRLASDARQARRSIAARPGATLAIVVVLALGIGLSSAMFALADPYLFRPLPYARPAELVDVAPRTFATSGLPTLDDWRARHDLFAGVAAAAEAVEVRAVRVEDREVTLRVALVSANYFEVLGLPVVLPGDWHQPAGLPVLPVALTTDAYRRVFNREDGIGRLLRSSAAEYADLRVTNLLPPSFVPPFASSGRDVDGFIPLGDRPLVEVEARGTFRRSTALLAIGRLRPGVTANAVEQALSTASLEGGRIPRTGVVVEARPLAWRAIENARTMAVGVLSTALAVLFVSIANVANLFLARGIARTREFAARGALGASRWDIARLVLVEVCGFTALGIAAGLLVAVGALAAVAAVIPAQYVTLGAPSVSLRVVAFAVLAGVLVVVASVLPAWAAWRVTPNALFERGSTDDTRLVRVVRFGMTTVQTMFAVVLLVGAALIGRSFINLMAQDPGYDANTFALQVRPPVVPSAGTSERTSLDDVNATLARLERIPGVSAAGVTDGPLVDGWTRMSVTPITVNGRRVKGDLRRVSPGFFRATNSRLVSGRFPSQGDQERAAVVTESFARDCCGASLPAGLVVEAGGRAFDIVGVVKDVHTAALDETPAPIVFLPIHPAPLSIVNYVLRVERPDATLALAAEREVLAVNRRASVGEGSTMRSRLLRSVNDRSFATLVSVLLAVAAVSVSAAGLVGVVAFVVVRRTREMAIRVAVGATAFDVIRLVTREATLAAAAGALAGLLAAWWLSRTIESLLFGLERTDPASFVLASLLVVLVVSCAAWVPARRATRLSPTVALRVE